jgi:hypothetical protein
MFESMENSIDDINKQIIENAAVTTERKTEKKQKKVVEGLTAGDLDKNRDMLSIKMQELNDMHVNGPVSRYATQTQMHDKVMYTNILLTALATSILYYLIVDI